MFGTKLRIRFSRPRTGYETSSTDWLPRQKGTAMSTAVLGSSAQGYSAPGYSAPANRAYAGERRDAPASHLRLTTRGRVVLAALVALPFLIAGGLAALGGGS